MGETTNRYHRIIQGTSKNYIMTWFEALKSTGETPVPLIFRGTLQWIFEQRWEAGSEQVLFDREDIETAADNLGIKLPKNLGDVIYTFRYRVELPGGTTRLSSAATGLISTVRLLTFNAGLAGGPVLLAFGDIPPRAD